jgi:hypothetical protein
MNKITIIGLDLAKSVFHLLMFLEIRYVTISYLLWLGVVLVGTQAKSHLVCIVRFGRYEVGSKWARFGHKKKALSRFCCNSLINMARLTGFEPVTPAFGG